MNGSYRNIVVGLALAFASMIAVWGDARAQAEGNGDAEAADEKAAGAEQAASGGESTDSEYRRTIERGRKAYNNGKYKRAAENYVEAIQAGPAKHDAYRNLARTLFWDKQYARAVTYYDFYLQLAPDSTDTKTIARERKLAAQRAGDNVWKMPESQKRVLSALRDELTEGSAYTKGGGGAWALYKTLLRTGYAQPDLAHMQKRLRRKLLEEFEATLVPDSGEPLPTQSLEDWQQQQLRLEAAKSLSPDADIRAVVNRRMHIVDAALALLNARYSTAAELADKALGENPDMAFVRWLQLSALVEDEQYERAREVVERFEKELGEGNQRRRAYLKAFRAILADRSGDAQSAADRYYDALK